ncbi:hypothetical protein RSAG8_04190, partial [Rhizoctonia solani AG-8 WAC10335]
MPSNEHSTGSIGRATEHTTQHSLSPALVLNLASELSSGQHLSPPRQHRIRSNAIDHIKMHINLPA